MSPKAKGRRRKTAKTLEEFERYIEGAARRFTDYWKKQRAEALEIEQQDHAWPMEMEPEDWHEAFVYWLAEDDGAQK